LEEFGACWEGLDDPRTGNAALHEFHDLLNDRLVHGAVQRSERNGYGGLCEGERTIAARFSQSEEWFAEPLHVQLAVQAARSGQVRRRVSAVHGGIFPAFPGGRGDRWQGFALLARQGQWSVALHMVSAWGCERRMVLGQIATDAKSNEITAVPKLLAMLSLKGTIVTMDALNCQRAIAQLIVDQGGNYALALKGNQGTQRDDLRLFLDDPAGPARATARTVDGDHGRIETRTAVVSGDIDWLQKQHDWPGLAAIAKVERSREEADKTTDEPLTICSARR
jgi:hypothetical protein